MLIQTTRKSVPFVEVMKQMSEWPTERTYDWAWSKFPQGIYTQNFAHRELFIDWMCLHHETNPNNETRDHDRARLEDIIPEQCWIAMNP